MSIQPVNLISAHYALSVDNTEYSSPASAKTIIDKFTATNTDSGSQTITVNIVLSGQSVSSSNIITMAFSITAGATADLTELKNQILEAGDYISVKASVGSKVVIRSSGRQVKS